MPTPDFSISETALKNRFSLRYSYQKISCCDLNFILSEHLLQFSDILLYTSRSQAALQFKVHGHMPLRGVMLEEPDGDIASFAFIIYGGNRALTVAANSQDEKDRWVADLTQAIQLARDRTDAKLTYLSLKSCSASFYLFFIGQRITYIFFRLVR